MERLNERNSGKSRSTRRAIFCLSFGSDRKQVGADFELMLLAPEFGMIQIQDLNRRS